MRLIEGSRFSNRKKFLLALVIFVVLLAAAYLPKISHVGYLQDDWNTLFVTENRSPGELIFHYSIDRPLRGYFSFLEDRVFGTNMHLFLASALIWRLLDTIIFYLILMLIWPGEWKFNLLICTLAIIYPGFHEQTNAYEYQAHLFSRLCFMISVLLSLLPFFLQRTWIKILSAVGAVVASIGSFALMEYYIGIEAFRLALFAVIYFRYKISLRPWKAGLYSLGILSGAGAFIYWRLFLFESRRASVDASMMLSGYKALGAKLLENVHALAVNLYRLVISAYYKPLLVFGKHVAFVDLVLGIVIALLTVGIVIVVLHSKKFDSEKSLEKAILDHHYPLNLVLVGLVGAVGGLVPVIFGGREITYTITGDRFSYPGSISACILLVGLISLLKPRWLQLGLVGALVFFSVLTQFTNDVIFEKNGNQTREVWWQMSWRAPQLKPETLLGGRIYLGILDEDYTLWGPANLIYYPGDHNVTVTAEVLDDTTLPVFLAGDRVFSERKGIAFEKDFANLLVISKTEDACLHIIDGEHPEYSQEDDKIILQAGTASDIDRIDISSTFNPIPRKDLFGDEPAHEWCYYYQKAQLARQQRNWELAAHLGDEAIRAEYYPNDPMEWLVFMQAFAYTKNSNYEVALAEVKADDYALEQACWVMSSYNTEVASSQFTIAHMQLIDDLCNE